MTELAPELLAPPVVTGTLELHYQADTLTNLDGSQVDTWPDSSGNGRDLTATGPDQKPVIRRTGWAHPYLEFDGAANLMKTYGSTFTLPQPTAWFIFWQPTVSDDGLGSTRAWVFDSRNSSVRQIFGRPGVGLARMYANTDLDVGPVVYPFDDGECWAGVFNGGSSRLFRQKTQIGAGPTGGASLEGFTVGGLNNGGTAGQEQMGMRVGEILYYTGTFTDAEITAVCDYLLDKWQPAGPAPPPPSGVGLRAIMDAIAYIIATTLDGIGLQVTPRLEPNPTPPCIDIYPADPFLEQSAMGYASREAVFVIRARVSTADNTAGQEWLLDLLDPFSDISMLAVLAQDAKLLGSVDDSNVVDPPSGFIVYENAGGGGALLGCEWRLRVIL